MPAIGETSGRLAVQDPDIRLMIRVRDDEEGAFEELVKKYQHRLFGILLHLTGRTDEAEDLCQEIFLRVYRARKKYRARARFVTWLYRIAHNAATNARRRRSRRPMQVLDPQDSRPFGPRPVEHLVNEQSSLAGQRLQQQELAEIVRQALERLNKRQRTAVLLNKFEDMNYTDIAKVMKMSTKAVKSLLSRARCNLRSHLEPYLE